MVPISSGGMVSSGSEDYQPLLGMPAGVTPSRPESLIASARSALRFQHIGVVGQNRGIRNCEHGLCGSDHAGAAWTGAGSSMPVADGCPDSHGPMACAL